jgi:hypothetical protein
LIFVPYDEESDEMVEKCDGCGHQFVVKQNNVLELLRSGSALMCYKCGKNMRAVSVVPPGCLFVVEEPE